MHNSSKNYNKKFSQNYTVSQKTRHQTLSHNFTNYYPIFKFFSLKDSVVNLQQTLFKNSTTLETYDKVIFNVCLQAGESHDEQRYVSLYRAWGQSHQWGPGPGRTNEKYYCLLILVYWIIGVTTLMNASDETCCSVQQTQKVVYDEHLNSKTVC